jgi:hypothetical protein
MFRSRELRDADVFCVVAPDLGQLNARRRSPGACAGPLEVVARSRSSFRCGGVPDRSGQPLFPMPSISERWPGSTGHGGGEPTVGTGR